MPKRGMPCERTSGTPRSDMTSAVDLTPTHEEPSSMSADQEEEAIRFYCGVNEEYWNKHPTAPGAYTCIAPVYGKTLRTKTRTRVRLPRETSVFLDSGAFSDGPGHRLSCEAALERQLAHSDRYVYAEQVTHIASYERLVDAQGPAA